MNTSNTKQPMSPAKRLLIMVACAVYIFSPIDLLPEIVLGPFGLIDDAAVALYGLWTAFQKR